ncbi:MAG TPA: tyrosine-type recombinase/integrase [Dokdonella sp.]|uniref:tyrosine-type recombinase/integrase n=1 Tax=Dokdonella sp. TaxID=2291710 RepID=UPI002CED5648|nr:tyrosine-type recombinase/integrase [Dokdonella sp.]HUD41979.1 tyrosine-type recombinase/integrase [Dokdonella sp.]
MAVKANDLAIKALRPRAVRYEVAVRDCRGLVVCVWPSGQRTYLLRYRQDGTLKRVSLSAATLSEARREWEGRREELRRGADPAAEVKTARAEKQLKRQAARAAPTMSGLAADFIELYAKRKKKSWRADELMLASAVLPEWGNLKAASIKRRDVIDLLDRIAERTPVRANRVLAVLRKLFNWALEREIVETSPCAGVKPPGTERSRERVLTDEEIRAFWNGLPASGLSETAQAALRLQLLTACRIGEAVGAEWSEIDLRKRQWLIPGARTKNGRENLVSLSSVAVDLLKERPSRQGYLFPAGGKTGHLRIDVATHDLAHATFDIATRFTSHDLRRTAATKMAELGTSRIVIDAILNHKDRSVGAVYDRYGYVEEKRTALEVWAQHLDVLATGKRPSNVIALRKRSGKGR